MLSATRPMNAERRQWPLASHASGRIVPSPVVYASPRVDVTERILERLRRQAAKAPAP